MRDDDFGVSEQLDLLGEMASGTDGVRIWDMACREDGIGQVRRRVAKVKVGQERLLTGQVVGRYRTQLVEKMGMAWREGE